LVKKLLKTKDKEKKQRKEKKNIDLTIISHRKPSDELSFFNLFFIP
jgi:hypothetical protein